MTIILGGGIRDTGHISGKQVYDSIHELWGDNMHVG